MMRRLRENLSHQNANYILPFLWMKGEDQPTIRREMAKIAQCGIREVCLESRPHPDFAGPRWWSDLEVVLEEARRLGMRVWILDDRKFPTGYANGGFERRPELAKIYLAERHMDMVGPKKGAAALISPFLGKDGRLLAALAVRRTDGASAALDGESTIDLTDRISGDYAFLDIPEGRWRLLVIYTTRTGGGREHYMNLLDARSVRVLIDEVYEKHYARFGAEFGRTIAGFFSDEPEIGNMPGYDFHELPGLPGRKLPWSDALNARLRGAWGADFVRRLPALWFDCGTETAPAREDFMSHVTDLVGECFSGQLGAWCAAHGVEYIGHVIEDDNAHARLGCSVGHYFKEMRGQHMAGVDVVHYQIMPGFEDPVHQWLSWDQDGSFFHHGLAKLASSSAHIDPGKQGRALCEIFGNYGWATGVSRMRWLTDHMLARGINHFVPHAFSMTFPDPDCPPHFYAGGNNPQFPAFAALMGYMNRMCHLISGGRARLSAGVLYHAEAEWAADAPLNATGGGMSFDRVGRALMERQCDWDVLPEDVLALPQSAIDGRGLAVNGTVYPCLIQPYCKRVPDHLARDIAAAGEKGLKIFVAEALPEAMVSGAPLPEGYVKAVRVMPLPAIADALQGARRDFTLEGSHPRLRTLVYDQPDGTFFMFFNESVSDAVDSPLRFGGDPERVWAYDAWENRAECLLTDGGALRLRLEPGEAKTFLIPFGDEPAEAVPQPVRAVEREILIDWRVSRKGVGDADFGPVELTVSGRDLPSMNAPGRFLDFCGSYRYEGAFALAADELDKRLSLFFPEIGDSAEVFVNGLHAGLLAGGGRRVDITGLVNPGENALTVIVTNTLVWQVRDPVSTQAPLDPTGMTLPPRLEIWE